MKETSEKTGDLFITARHVNQFVNSTAHRDGDSRGRTHRMDMKGSDKQEPILADEDRSSKEQPVLFFRSTSYRIRRPEGTAIRLRP